MTTRRRRPGPPAPPRGRIGLFGRSAIAASVEGLESRIDPHGAAEGARERAPSGRALEAREPPAGVDAAARSGQVRDERSGSRYCGVPAHQELAKREDTLPADAPETAPVATAAEVEELEPVARIEEPGPAA